MSGIRTAQCNGITLAYETFGDPDDVPILLVMGLGTQMLAWPDEFCAMLVERGHYVIRFDNRDMGLSTHFDDAAKAQPVSAFLGRRPLYLLTDMAADTADLIGELGLPSVHVVGVSMGGCISQELTLARPDLIRSLTSMSSSTASRRVGRPRFDIAARMVTAKRAADRDAGDRDEPCHLAPDRITRLSAGRRSRPADGRDRLRPALRPQGRCPAVRRHPRHPGPHRATPSGQRSHSGAARRGGPVDRGVRRPATAAAIPGSRLVTFPGMGHDLPEALWSRFVEEITAVVALGEARKVGPV